MAPRQRRFGVRQRLLRVGGVALGASARLGRGDVLVVQSPQPSLGVRRAGLERGEPTPDLLHAGADRGGCLAVGAGAAASVPGGLASPVAHAREHLLGTLGVYGGGRGGLRPFATDTLAADQLAAPRAVGREHVGASVPAQPRLQAPADRARARTRVPAPGRRAAPPSARSSSRARRR